MDLNSMLDRHQRSLMIGDRALTFGERRAHSQFAREYAERIRSTRALLGARPSLEGSVT